MAQVMRNPAGRRSVSYRARPGRRSREGRRPDKGERPAGRWRAYADARARDFGTWVWHGLLLLLLLATAGMFVTRLTASDPVAGDCTRTVASRLGERAVVGPLAGSCQVSATAVNLDGFQETEFMGPPADDIPLTFPEGLLAAAPPMTEGGAPAEQPVVPAGEGGRSAAPARASVPTSQGPPPPEVAVQLFRQLGLPLPELLGNGVTFRNDGQAPGGGPLANQGSGGSGAPSAVVIDGTLNGSNPNPPAQPAPPPTSTGSISSFNAPPDPSLGGPGTSEPGQPGDPGNRSIP